MVETLNRRCQKSGGRKLLREFLFSVVLSWRFLGGEERWRDWGSQCRHFWPGTEVQAGRFANSLSFFLVVASASNPKGLGFKDDRGYEHCHHKSPNDGVWCNCCIEGTPSGIYFNYLIRYLLFLCNNRLRSGMMWHMWSRRKSSSNYDTFNHEFLMLIQHFSVPTLLFASRSLWWFTRFVFCECCTEG